MMQTQNVVTFVWFYHLYLFKQSRAEETESAASASSSNLLSPSSVGSSTWAHLVKHHFPNQNYTH